MLSSGMQCYHLELMLSSGMKCYHLVANVIIRYEMLSSGANVIIWDKILSSGTKCYHLGWNVIIWNAMLSSGANFIIWDKMLSCGANVVMLSYGANVIIWCYLVMLSSGMITPPFLFFLKTSLTRYKQVKQISIWTKHTNYAVLFSIFSWLCFEGHLKVLSRDEHLSLNLQM